ncbi:hypothetical protein [Anoxybacter fermentans]|uniref:hypothetical protein n=1 Tax=Anoxybacter fermentans TaxID=1323375 RepID=UPI001F25C63C|nr:hypothetical protein [Anoxybacter fermentans]
MGTGEGKPVDTDLIIAGTNPVAVDVVGARLLGFRLQAVHYMDQLIRIGYEEGDLTKVTLKGLSLNETEKIFSLAAYGYQIV